MSKLWKKTGYLISLNLQIVVALSEQNTSDKEKNNIYEKYQETRSIFRNEDQRQR